MKSEGLIFMTTNSDETVVQRSVSELLAILEETGSYQEMTDAEIQSIVDYEKTLSFQRGRTEGTESVLSQHCASVLSATETALQAQTSMLQSIIDRATNLQLQGVQHG